MNYYIIEQIENKYRGSSIEKITMNEQSSLEMLKLSECKISRSSSVSSLLSEYTNANMCLLNHAHIVCTVTDGACHWPFFTPLYQLDHPWSDLVFTIKIYLLANLNRGSPYKAFWLGDMRQHDTASHFKATSLKEFCKLNSKTLCSEQPSITSAKFLSFESLILN